MPLGPLPPSNTARFRVHYSIGSFSHTAEMRTTISPAAFGTLFHQFLTALGPILAALVISFVEWAPAGSDVFNSVITGIEGNTYGSGGLSLLDVGNYYNFIGRSSGGRRNRLAIFGAINLGNDYRLVAGENAASDAAVAVLVGASINTLAIDGLPTVWKTYVNTGTNVHWQKAVRP